LGKKVDIVYSFSLILLFMGMVGDVRVRVDEPSGPIITELFLPTVGYWRMPYGGFFVLRTLAFYRLFYEGSSLVNRARIYVP
jgi:hypothetical protein